MAVEIFIFGFRVEKRMTGVGWGAISTRRFHTMVCVWGKRDGGCSF